MPVKDIEALFNVNNREKNYAGVEPLKDFSVPGILSGSVHMENATKYL